MPRSRLTSVELCAGAGGQALGLEAAGFKHLALVEIDHAACESIRRNRPHWPVIEGDLRNFDARPYRGVDLVAAGVPCPPFSVAGKQLGDLDERDLFPEALRVVEESQPRAVLIENVRGIMHPAFDSYRARTLQTLRNQGFECDWRLLNASDYGVPQLRPRAVLVAIRRAYWRFFRWPEPKSEIAPTVGAVLRDEMASRGWEGADSWAMDANAIAPTLVGGSRKHGGPDLGPTRAKQAWKKLGVDAMALADAPPDVGYEGLPRLTVRMTALLQGFPADWEIVGKKTPAYRQVGNAFPPPVAREVGSSILSALSNETATSTDIEGRQLKLVGVD